MVSEFKYVRRVEFSDTDMAGIMHFSRFLSLWNPLNTPSSAVWGIPFIPG